VRNLTAPLTLIGAFAVSGSVLANEVSLQKHTAEEIKTVCEKVGGKFSQDAAGYDCGTDCHGGPGTDCVVGCKTDQPCFAQVIGSKRPTTVINALQAPARRTR
jgi:hypothetical protein